MYIIRKEYKVEYAHQLQAAYSKCCSDSIHGHSGKIEVYFTSDELDENGMVIDFGEISGIIKEFIMSTLDHALVMPKSMDSAYIKCLQKNNKNVLITDDNPTAEHFAESLYWDICQLIQPIIDKRDNKFKLLKVRFHETDTGYAEYLPVKGI